MQPSQVVQHRADLGVVGAKGLFVKREAALVQRLRLGVAALDHIQIS